MSLVNGVVVGLVTNVNDPNKSGNVKVHFPWLDDQHESDWIRIATTMSGNGRGTFFMPEVNDEVLVAFEHGDARFPYIVGFLWNGKDAPPETNVNKRTIKSKKGHTVVLDDGDDSEKITVQSSSGHQVVLDDTGAGKTITIQTAGSLAVVLDDKDSSIEMRGGGRKIAMRGGIVQVT
jgi:uncharacterized protein involved in type VI secretion and phage assembly